ncbi:MAG: lipoprotein insertase outer membrane protein LolB [Steroidobacterales bacterium]
MLPRLAAALGVAALGLLAGCRTLPVVAPVSVPWEERRPQLQARDHFELKGRVAIAVADQGVNANLQWTQAGASTQVTLEGPLGVGAVRINATGNRLAIVTADGQRLDNDAAHAELANRLGFDPPLQRLRFWIQGVPDPATPATETIEPGQQRLQALAQDGWSILYMAYTQVGNEWLPQRLTVQRDAVRVRLLVDGWRL